VAKCLDVAPHRPPPVHEQNSLLCKTKISVAGPADSFLSVVIDDLARHYMFTKIAAGRLELCFDRLLAGSVRWTGCWAIDWAHLDYIWMRRTKPRPYELDRDLANSRVPV
jgi:hypothetical protein